MASPKPVAPTAPLRLHGLDAEDLQLISAHLQDALLRVGDLAYLPEEKRFALVASRFDWTAQTRGHLERCRTGVHFETVRSARFKGVPRDRPDEMLSLLAIYFEPGEILPEGRIRLVFSGDAAILLEVDCIEAQLCDLGPRWAVANCPTHKLDEGAAPGS